MDIFYHTNNILNFYINLVSLERNMSQISESVWSNRCYYEAAMDAYQVFKATGKTASSKVNSQFENQSARFLHIFERI